MELTTNLAPIIPNENIRESTTSLMSLKMKQLIFLDIETVSQYPDYKTLKKENPEMAFAWKQKFENDKYWKTENPKLTLTASYPLKAALYPEYGKIVAISVCYEKIIKDKEEIITISFANHEEKELLKQFSVYAIGIHNRKAVKMDTYLCGHNIKMFDIPYMFKRMLANDIYPPSWIYNPLAKPWDMKHLDTSLLWNAGGRWGGGDLNSMAVALGFKSPKDNAANIKGKDISTEYWKGEEDILNRITHYCEMDTEMLVKTIQKTMKLTKYEYKR